MSTPAIYWRGLPGHLPEGLRQAVFIEGHQQLKMHLKLLFVQHAVQCHIAITEWLQERRSVRSRHTRQSAERRSTARSQQGSGCHKSTPCESRSASHLDSSAASKEPGRYESCTAARFMTTAAGDEPVYTPWPAASWFAAAR